MNLPSPLKKHVGKERGFLVYTVLYHQASTVALWSWVASHRVGGPNLQFLSQNPFKGPRDLRAHALFPVKSSTDELKWNMLGTKERGFGAPFLYLKRHFLSSQRSRSHPLGT